jgi:uncharacterized protein
MKVRSDQAVLVAMARVPSPGTPFKSRLSRRVPLEADRRYVYVAMLQDKVAQLRRSRRFQPALAVAPPDDPEALRFLTGEGFRLFPQRGSDFGARLMSVAETALAEAPFVCIVDTDTPSLPDDRFQEAYDVLHEERADVVLGPSWDGGYYLIGLRAPAPSLFTGVDWSTSRVLAQTIRHAQATQLRVHLLEGFRDIDEPDDLDDLHRTLQRDQVARSLATHTAIVLDELFPESILPAGRPAGTERERKDKEKHGH